MAPTSARLAALMASPVPTDGHPTIVELGPGTGSVSDSITERMSPSGRHLAIEIDPVMASWLQRTRTNIEVVEGNAVDLPAILASRGVSSVDTVVSSLPWSLFTAEDQAAMLTGIATTLSPNGCFITFAYVTGRWLPSARRFSRLLRETFCDVVVTPTVWLNVPPAVVYISRRPRLATGSTS